MAFQLTKISSQGTANPVVARFCVQTSELIKFCSRGEEFHRSVLSLYHDHIQKHLLECDQIAQSIAQDVLRIDEEIGSGGFKIQAQGRVIEVPNVLRLVPQVEQFLYCSKSALRDLTKIFALFFGKSFQEARYDKIVAWAEKEFGPNCELARMFREDHDLWIKKLVAMRNAVEHPGGYSGHLHIHNISLVSPSHPNYPILEPPSWHLNDDPKESLVAGLLTAVSNLLELCEDTLVVCITMSGLPPMLGFAEIPEAERNHACPVRIRVVLKQEEI